MATVIQKRLTDEQLARLSLFKRVLPEIEHPLDGGDFTIIMDYIMTGVLNPKALQWDWEIS